MYRNNADAVPREPYCKHSKTNRDTDAKDVLYL